ncbi:MAG: hypothetical protein ABIR58_04710 [Gemmatimonadaceae bacterium]
MLTPVATTALLTILSIACSNNPAGPVSPQYNPMLPTSWSATVTNPWFPLTAGTTMQYRAQTSDGLETITVEVLAEKKMIKGVSATLVRDRVYLNNNLVEDTFDWYAQDSDGNVWYLGEAVKDYENGVVVSTAGSWEWGVDNALPGIQMWANPASKVGTEYRQEYYKGHAEDWGKVISVNESATVPLGSFANCVTVEERVGLEPNQPHETKTYCSGVGNVSGGRLGATDRYLLISRTP